MAGKAKRLVRPDVVGPEDGELDERSLPGALDKSSGLLVWRAGRVGPFLRHDTAPGARMLRSLAPVALYLPVCVLVRDRVVSINDGRKVGCELLAVIPASIASTAFTRCLIDDLALSAYCAFHTSSLLFSQQTETEAQSAVAY